jgi:hypothetical protein
VLSSQVCELNRFENSLCVAERLRLTVFAVSGRAAIKEPIGGAFGSRNGVSGSVSLRQRGRFREAAGDSADDAVIESNDEVRNDDGRGHENDNDGHVIEVRIDGSRDSVDNGSARSRTKQSRRLACDTTTIKLDIPVDDDSDDESDSSDVNDASMASTARKTRAQALSRTSCMTRKLQRRAQ